MSNNLDFITKLALEAGDLLRSYFSLQGIGVTVKADHTALTKADMAADALIRQRISERYPEDGILTEEGDTRYPSGHPTVWVVDPLDGTTNFSLGLHHWGVSIARLEEGTPTLAALYFPLLDELYTAEEGSGATLNGQPLRITTEAEGRPFTFFACCSRTIRRYHVALPYKTRILGSAAYNLVTVARGSAALAFETTPKVWDFAASWLIMREAGGVVAAHTGEALFPLIPGEDYGVQSAPVLAAPSNDAWRRGQQHIQPKLSGG